MAHIAVPVIVISEDVIHEGVRSHFFTFKQFRGLRPVTVFARLGTAVVKCGNVLNYPLLNRPIAVRVQRQLHSYFTIDKSRGA